ncbi:MAG: cytochrome c3 family protein [bacterium]|nr:cytochrome c3 family protein [bacterium]
MKKNLLFLFVFCIYFFPLPTRSEAAITIISPDKKIYIFTNTVFIVGKTDAKKLRYWLNGEEGPFVNPRDGNFHFPLNLNYGLNKIEVSDIDVKEKIQLEVFSLKNYKFFVLKTYDSTGPAGFSSYIFHTGKKDGQCIECHAMDPMKSDRKMCYSLCHKKDIMKWGYMHGPAGEGACLACHDPEGYNNGYKVVVDGGGQICVTCHEGIGSMKANAHTAVKKLFCMGCHSPHGTTNDFVLWEDGKAKMCYLCHLDKKVKWKSIKDENGKESFVEDGAILVPHKAISDGDCLGCHHPHESDELFNLRQPPAKLCVETECHIPIIEKIKKHKHPSDLQPTSGSPVAVEKGIFLDEKENIVCYSCHNPHGSDNKFIFWKPVEKLCPSCHPNMEQKKE